MTWETLAGLLVQAIKLGATSYDDIATAVTNIHDALASGEEPSPADIRAIMDAIAAKQAEAPA